MTADCPVSWLRLEQFALDELAPAERSTVGVHLAECPACRARLDEIHGDVRPLPALPPVRPARRWPVWAVPLALAAAALIAVQLRPRAVALPGPRIEVKGGELAVTLVRERDGATDPATFADGDRFQVRVTCPPGAAVELAVFSGGEASFPLTAPACGNQVVAGAIALTGAESAAICAVSGVPREDLAAGPAALGDEAACAVVTPGD